MLYVLTHAVFMENMIYCKHKLDFARVKFIKHEIIKAETELKLWKVAWIFV